MDGPPYVYFLVPPLGGRQGGERRSSMRGGRGVRGRKERTTTGGEREGKKRIRSQGPKGKRKGSVCEVEGPKQKKKEKEEGGCKKAGGGKGKSQG